MSQGGLAAVLGSVSQGEVAAGRAAAVLGSMSQGGRAVQDR